MCFENSHQSRLLRHFFSLSLIYTIFIIFCVLSKEKKLYRRITWQGRQKENITKSQFLCFWTGHHASGVITGDRLAKRPFWEFRMTKQCTGIEHEEIKENTTDGFFTKHCVEKNTIPTHFFRGWVLLLHPDRACKKKKKRDRIELRKDCKSGKSDSEKPLKPSRQFFTKPIKTLGAESPRQNPTMKTLTSL